MVPPQQIGGLQSSANRFLPDPKSQSGLIRQRGIEYPVLYRVDPDGQTFTLILVRGFNMRTTVTGGVNTPLQAVINDEVRSRVIPVP